LFGRPLAGQEVARRAGVSRPLVWRWQARYAEQGVDGLLRDAGHATHWTGRAMAKAVGVSLRPVQR
jgi:transposase